MTAPPNESWYYTRMTILREVITLVLGTVLLSSAAIYNRYPLVYPDTGGYLVVFNFVVRSMFYGIFVYPSHLIESLWFVACLQALLVAFLLRIILRVVFRIASTIGYLITIALLCLLSSLPWYVGYLMPDIFTPMVVLCVFLLAFCFERLNRIELVFVVLLTFVSEVVHYSHVPIAVGLLLVLFGIRFVKTLRRVQYVAPRLALPMIVTTVATAAIVLSNYITLGLVTFSAGGYAFLLARLMADGQATEYLREECGNRRYFMCYYLRKMPMDAGTFLWGNRGPFHGLTPEFLEQRKEGVEIVEHTLERFPLWSLQSAIANSMRQLTRVETGTDLISFANAEFPTQDLGKYYPADYDDYLASRQSRSELFVLEWLKPIHKLTVSMSSIYCIMLMVLLTRRKEWLPLALLFTIACGLLMNSFVAGALSEPQPRYGGRVIWLLPLFAIASWRKAGTSPPSQKQLGPISAENGQSYDSAKRS